MSEDDEVTGSGGAEQWNPDTEIAAGSVSANAARLFGSGGPLSGGGNGDNESFPPPKTPARTSGIKPPSSPSDPKFYTPAAAANAPTGGEFYTPATTTTAAATGSAPRGEKWDPGAEIKSGSVMANAAQLWGAGGAFGGVKEGEDEEEAEAEAAAESSTESRPEISSPMMKLTSPSADETLDSIEGMIPLTPAAEGVGDEADAEAKSTKKKDRKKKKKKKKSKDADGEEGAAAASEPNQAGGDADAEEDRGDEAEGAAENEEKSPKKKKKKKKKKKSKDGDADGGGVDAPAGASELIEESATDRVEDDAGGAENETAPVVGATETDADQIQRQAEEELTEGLERAADAAAIEDTAMSVSIDHSLGGDAAKSSAGSLNAEDLLATAVAEAEAEAKEEVGPTTASESPLSAVGSSEGDEEERRKIAEEAEAARAAGEEALRHAEEAETAAARALAEAEDFRRVEKETREAAAGASATASSADAHEEGSNHAVEKDDAVISGAAVPESKGAPEKWDPAHDISRGSVSSNAARVLGLLNAPKAEKVDASADIAAGSVSSNAARIFGEGVQMEKAKVVHLEEIVAEEDGDAIASDDEVEVSVYDVPPLDVDEEGQAVTGMDLLSTRFAVRPGASPLRHTAAEFLIRARDGGNNSDTTSEGGGGHAVVLQFMSDPRAFAAELSARGAVRDAAGAHTPSILPVVAAFVDDSNAIDALKFTGRPVVEVAPCEDLVGSAASLLPRNESDNGWPRYPYLLILEDHGPTLEDYLARNPLADLGLARRVAADVVEAVMRLHTAGLVHRDLTPGCVVQARADTRHTERGRWQLTGLGSCGRDEDEVKGREGVARRCKRWGYLPPEAARVLLQGGEGDGDAPAAVCATAPAWDLWSLGCVLYRLVLGSEVWQESRDGRVSEDDLGELAGWSSRSVWRREQSGGYPQGGRTDEERAAIDLVAKLLAPTPEDRLRNFELGIFSVHEHEFVEGKPLEAASLVALEGRWRLLSTEASDRERYLLLTSTLGIEERWELARARDVLLLGAFEPVDVHVPTSFVILKEPLPVARGGRGKDADGAKSAAETCLGEAMQWLSFLDDVGPLVRRTLVSGGVRSIGEFWNKVEVMFGGEYCFLYYIDDLTGEPILTDDNDDNGGGGGGYPIPIKTRGDMLPKLLPLMHSTMRSAALFHGAVGLARMFGAGSDPILSDAARTSSRDRIRDLKGESGGMARASFGSFLDDIDAARGRGSRRETFLRSETNVRCRAQAELVRFLERKGVIAPGKHGIDGDFAGLHRLADESDRAVWTVLDSEAAVKRAIFKRKEERLKEEQNLWSSSKVGSVVRELEASLETTNNDINDTNHKVERESDRANTAQETIKELEEELLNKLTEHSQAKEKVHLLDQRGLGAVAEDASS